MMMNNDFEHDLDSLLKTYGEGAEDDGFSDAVISRANGQANMRARFIAIACFLSGLIVASQFKSFEIFARKIGAVTPDIAPARGFDFSAIKGGMMGTSGSLTTLIAGAAVCGFILWLATDVLDRQI